MTYRLTGKHEEERLEKMGVLERMKEDEQEQEEEEEGPSVLTSKMVATWSSEVNRVECSQGPDV